MSDVMTIVLVAVVAAVLALIAFLIIRRQRYVRALRSRGWTFESSPQLDSVLDHHAPPFGLGFVRKVDEAVSGTTSAGVPFRVFEYARRRGWAGLRRTAGQPAAALGLARAVRHHRGAA